MKKKNENSIICSTKRDSLNDSLFSVKLALFIRIFLYSLYDDDILLIYFVISDNELCFLLFFSSMRSISIQQSIYVTYVACIIDFDAFFFASHMQRIYEITNRYYIYWLFFFANGVFVLMSQSPPQ